MCPGDRSQALRPNPFPQAVVVCAAIRILNSTYIPIHLSPPSPHEKLSVNRQNAITLDVLSHPFNIVLAVSFGCLLKYLLLQIRFIPVSFIYLIYLP